MVAALVILAAPGAVEAQELFVAPLAGWSEFRRYTLGAQVGVRVVGGLDLTAEGLVFFPEETAVGEPGVSVDRDAVQANASLVFAPDLDRRLVLYGGLGLSWARSSRSVVVDGLRHRTRGTGTVTTLVLAARLPRAGPTPFVEWRTELGRESQWVVVTGARLPLG